MGAGLGPQLKNSIGRPAVGGFLFLHLRHHQLGAQNGVYPQFLDCDFDGFLLAGGLNGPDMLQFLADDIDALASHQAHFFRAPAPVIGVFR